MKLQKMRYRLDNRTIKLICAVNLYCHSGDYTICGNAIPDSCLEFNNCESYGNEFDGVLKQVTCLDCMNFINFVKNFK